MNQLNVNFLAKYYCQLHILPNCVLLIFTFLIKNTLEYDFSHKNSFIMNFSLIF